MTVDDNARRPVLRRAGLTIHFLLYRTTASAPCCLFGILLDVVGCLLNFLLSMLRLFASRTRIAVCKIVLSGPERKLEVSPSNLWRLLSQAAGWPISQLVTRILLAGLLGLGLDLLYFVIVVQRLLALDQ